MKTIFPVLMATLIAAFAMAPASIASPIAQARNQNGSEFTTLNSSQRVYDETNGSLDAGQVADLNERLEGLQRIGADTILYVRALDATPEETLNQVEALQQAWVRETGANQDNAVAILINRNPNNRVDARAGIFVGSTFDYGNVPRSEQVAIVEEALIPPLRDGDVYTSLVQGIARLESAIFAGPPVNSSEQWASEAGTSWAPWAGLIAALTGLGLSLALFQRRQIINRKDFPPTTTRPEDNLPPAIAGALATGGPQASAVPATILDLAHRGALAIEPEREASRFRKPTVQIRQIDGNLIRNDFEAVLWQRLDRRAKDGVISSQQLQAVAIDSGAVRKSVEGQLVDRGWLDPKTSRARAVFVVIALAAAILAIASFVIAVAGAVWFPVISALALAGLAVTALTMFSAYPTFTPVGQEAALPWRAYRDGLAQAAQDETIVLDLDATLADIVAMNLGSKLQSRLKQAQEAGQTLQGFFYKQNRIWRLQTRQGSHIGSHSARHSRPRVAPRQRQRAGQARAAGVAQPAAPEFNNRR